MRTPKELSHIRRKLKVLNYAKEVCNAAAACRRRFGISGETFYKWKRAYERDGERALSNSKPCPRNPKLRTPAHMEEKTLYLRRTYHLGQQPIAWYLLRYHDIKNVEAPGINHTYIRVRTPRLNGKVERSPRTDKVEFYQLQTYTDDLDLNEKPGEWENFYNYFRPHRSLKGQPLTKFSGTSYN